jgi:hypothetical protein
MSSVPVFKYSYLMEICKCGFSLGLKRDTNGSDMCDCHGNYGHNLCRLCGIDVSIGSRTPNEPRITYTGLCNICPILERRGITDCCKYCGVTCYDSIMICPGCQISPLETEVKPAKSTG